MNVYLDASALVKHYILESGTDRVHAILSSASEIGMAVIAPTEIISAFCRRRREGGMTSREYQAAKKTLEADVRDAILVDLTESVFARAMEILERWPLRAADALHIACAAEWACDLFVSADERQCKAARTYGLRVERVAVG